MRRLKRFSLVRLRDGERGATLAIVGISLLCLLGMLVLTFDLGRGVAIKRNMVNAADAGALAAARACGLAQGTDDAEKAAQQLVGENNAAATVTSVEFDDAAQCSGGAGAGKRQVTVTVNVTQEYFFAQIFGRKSGTVSASATAEWTTGVQNPVPLKLDQLKVDDCLTDANGVPRADLYAGAECAFEYEKIPGGTGSNRGILDFPEGWPTSPDENPMSCTSNAGGSRDLQDYIDQMGSQGQGGFLPVLFDPSGQGNPPTYACAEGGVNADAIQAIVDWLNNIVEQYPNPVDRPVVYFPVVACNAATDTGTPEHPCRQWYQTAGHESYPVMSFVAMRVEGAYKGQEARNNENCTFQTNSNDVFCVQLSVARFEGGNPPGGAVKVWLVD